MINIYFLRHSLFELFIYNSRPIRQLSVFKMSQASIIWWEMAEWIDWFLWCNYFLQIWLGFLWKVMIWMTSIHFKIWILKLFHILLQLIRIGVILLYSTGHWMNWINWIILLIMHNIQNRWAAIFTLIFKGNILMIKIWLNFMTFLTFLSTFFVI